MSMDLGNAPVGTPPTTDEKTQLRVAMGCGTAATKDTGTGAGQVPVRGDYDPAGSAATVQAVAVTKTRMVVTNAFDNLGAPVAFDIILFAGISNGKAYFESTNNHTAEWFTGSGGYWTLYKGSSEWHSSEDVATPDLVTTWTPYSYASLSPTVTPQGNLADVPSNAVKPAATPSIRALGAGATDAMPGDAAVLRATGATAGATSQAQAFTNGVSAGGVTLTEVLGTELIIDGGLDDASKWTGGTGWTLTAGKFAHAAGTGTLVPHTSVAPAATIGTVYKIQYTVSSWTVAGLAVAFGGVTGQTTAHPTADGVYTCYVKATAVTSLVFTPLTGFRGSLDTISVKAVTAGGATGGGLIQHPSGESHLYADAAAKDAHRTAMGVGTGDSPTLTGLTVKTITSATSEVDIKPSNGVVRVTNAASNGYSGLEVWTSNFGAFMGGFGGTSAAAALFSLGVGSYFASPTSGEMQICSGVIGTFRSLTLLNLTATGTLGVTGAATVTGLATLNGGVNTAGMTLTEVLGAEACPTFADAANWTVGAGWTVDAGNNNSAIHGTSSDGTLVPNPYLVSVIGAVYKIVITFSALTTGGLMTLILGGVTKTYTLVAGETSHTAYIKATAVTGLSLKMASAVRCTISVMSVKPVTAGGATGGGLIQHPSGESHLYADAAAKDAHRTAMGIGELDTVKLTAAGHPSTNQWDITATQAKFAGYQVHMDSGFVNLAPQGGVRFSSVDYNPAGTKDAGISRVSAGLIGVGTGAQGSIAGSMSFLNLTLGGALAVTGATTVTGLLTANGGIQSGTGAGEIDVTSASGALLGIRTVEATSAAMSGATVTVGTNIIPAGSYVLGVTVRVMTLVACGSSTFQVGDGTDADAWGSAIAVAAGTASASANFNITAPAFYAAATNVVLTANGTAFTAGVVKVAVHYITLTGPTA